MTQGFNASRYRGNVLYLELPDDMNRLLDKWRGYISNRELE